MTLGAEGAMAIAPIDPTFTWSKIGLADPSLADSSPRLIERSPAPAPMRITPRPEPTQEKPEDESTRAMDREVLERAAHSRDDLEFAVNAFAETDRELR